MPSWDNSTTSRYQCSSIRNLVLSRPRLPCAAPEPARSGFHRLIVEAVSASAGLLGMIHRLVCDADQGAGIVRVIGVDADAKTGRDSKFVSGNEEVLVHCTKQLLRYGRGIFRVTQFGQDHDELVASQSGDRVHLPERAADAFGHLLQQHVADMMAQAVVDDLEMVEIHEYDRSLGMVAL